MSVKNGLHARRAALMSLVLNIFFPLLLFIPSLAAVVLFPNIAERFPNLSHPSEAAYVAVCMKMMPHGLMGLLVSGIFAAAMAGMDIGLNRNTGIFIKNFYSEYLRPHASEKELLLASRVFTAIFGLLIVGGGVLIALVRSTNLFDLALIIGSLITVPLIVPMAWGLFIKRTPSWSAWSTALIGFVVAACAKWVIGVHLYLWIAGGNTENLRPQEITDIRFSTTVFLVTMIGSAWYLFTMRFADCAPESYKLEVESFFKDMRTPIDPVAEKIVYDDGRQYRAIGMLCLIYGTAMMFGILIPNPLQGRLCFAYVASVLLIIGWLLYRNYQKAVRKAAETNQLQNPMSRLLVLKPVAPSYEDH